LPDANTVRRFSFRRPTEWASVAQLDGASASGAKLTVREHQWGRYGNHRSGPPPPAVGL